MTVYMGYSPLVSPNPHSTLPCSAISSFCVCGSLASEAESSKADAETEFKVQGINTYEKKREKLRLGRGEGKLQCRFHKASVNLTGNSSKKCLSECPTLSWNDPDFVLPCHLLTRFTRSPRKGSCWVRWSSATEVDLEVTARQRMSANCTPCSWVESFTLRRGCWGPSPCLPHQFESQSFLGLISHCAHVYHGDYFQGLSVLMSPS